MSITPRNYQIQADQMLFEFLNQTRNRHPLVCMPTGTGKSLMIGWFIAKVLSRWSGQRILAMTHVKELLTQNSNKLVEIWPSAPYGIFSAGLKQREVCPLFLAALPAL
jgi:DNA repair protein RadD